MKALTSSTALWINRLSQHTSYFQISNVNTKFCQTTSVLRYRISYCPSPLGRGWQFKAICLLSLWRWKTTVRGWFEMTKAASLCDQAWMWVPLFETERLVLLPAVMCSWRVILLEFSPMIYPKCPFYSTSRFQYVISMSSFHPLNPVLSLCLLSKTFFPLDNITRCTWSHPEASICSVFRLVRPPMPWSPLFPLSWYLRLLRCEQNRIPSASSVFSPTWQTVVSSEFSLLASFCLLLQPWLIFHSFHYVHLNYLW